MDRDTRDPSNEPDPREELERLARGLRRQANRRRRLGGALPGEAAAAPPPAGATDAPRASPPAPGAARATDATAPTASPRPPAGPRPASRSSQDRPRAADGYRPTIAAGPARDADEVRAQAQSAPDLSTLRAGVAQCQACALCQTRTQTVFQDGEGASGVLFIGEAPGADEDRTGIPFVGRAGQLLTDIITKGMGLARREVWIANVLKCRPPDNREPTPEEKAICTPWLDRQIELLGPRILIPLGRHASMHVLGFTAPMSQMRGRVHDVRGRPVVPTFHPAYLLRSPGEKKECWKDIQLAMQTAGIPLPPRATGSEPGPTTPA
ncbi:MAG: uracil-DNA glycosylase [Planctomycetes bacterium]|nr:uracil-DNA glycosylase [Planctomycetota bacterium]